MGFKTNLIALSTDVPRLAITAGDEGGRSAAEAVVAEIFPGRALTFSGTSNVYEASYPGDDSVGVSTFGDVVVLGGNWVVEKGHDEVVAAARGRTVWEVSIHSVVDLCHIEVRAPDGRIVRKLDRYTDMEPGDVDAGTRGDPLPFEAPYWAGEHPVSDDEEEDAGYGPGDSTPFHPLDMGEAAMGWIFGFYGESAPPDAVQDSLTTVDGFDVPMHVFTIGSRPKKDGFLRLFGR